MPADEWASGALGFTGGLAIYIIPNKLRIVDFNQQFIRVYQNGEVSTGRRINIYTVVSLCCGVLAGQKRIWRGRCVL